MNSTQMKKLRKEEKENKENALQLAVVKHHPCPDNFNHSAYLKFLKSFTWKDAKEEILVKQVMDPFHNNLASRSKKKGRKVTLRGGIYVFKEEELESGQYQTLMTMLKVKATVTVVLYDKHLEKLPLIEHILFTRSLSQHIVDVLNLSRTSVEHIGVLNSAAFAIKRLFTLTHGSSSGSENSAYSLAESGIEFMLDYLIKYIMQDYSNAGIQMQKQELVLDILHILKPVPIRRKMFELLCSATKVGLNRIHRASLNQRNQYSLPMNDVETVLRYLMVIEALMLYLPSILEHELVALLCIQRTSLGVVKGCKTLLGMYVTRIVEVARSRLDAKRPRCSSKRQGVHPPRVLGISSINSDAVIFRQKAELNKF